MKYIFVYCVVAAIFYKNAEAGLQCFVCTIANSEADQICLTKPAGIPGSIVQCKKEKYCSIMRQEYKDPPGKIASFWRGCEDNPPFMNTETEDGTFKYYFRSCTEDICNGGFGNDTGFPSINGDDDGEGVLRVPGISHAVGITANVLVVLFTLLLICKCN